MDKTDKIIQIYFEQQLEYVLIENPFYLAYKICKFIFRVKKKDNYSKLFVFTVFATLVPLFYFSMFVLISLKIVKVLKRGQQYIENVQITSLI